MVFGFDDAMLIMAAAGAATSIYGQISGANAQQEAAERNQANANDQARELMAREAINEQIMREKSAEAQSTYRASWGSHKGEGGGIGGVLKMQKDLAENIALANRDAAFKARMLRAGAQIELELASDRMTAAYIGSAGTLLSTGAQAFQTYDKYNKSIKTDNLPGVK